MSEMEIITEKIKTTAQQHGLAYVWVFGSYAKGTQTPESDIDIMVRTEDVSQGFKIVEVKFAFEEALGKRVDIVTTESIKGSLLEDEDLNEILIYNSENAE